MTVATTTPEGEFSSIESEPAKIISDGGSLTSCTLIVKFSTTLKPGKQKKGEVRKIVSKGLIINIRGFNVG